MMRKCRRITAGLVALTVALAPVICVCADSMLLDEAKAALINSPGDCHSEAPASKLADDEPCPGCDEGTPASVSKTKSDAIDYGLLGADFLPTPRFTPGRSPAAILHHPHFRQATPVTLKVVLLN